MIGCTHPKVSTPNAFDKEYIYNTLSTTKGINVCYNSNSGNVECCDGFINRTGICESNTSCSAKTNDNEDNSTVRCGCKSNEGMHF
ncbi:uncharacterized protein LOC144624922 [Crassostrea virginica]